MRKRFSRLENGNEVRLRPQVFQDCLEKQPGRRSSVGQRQQQRGHQGENHHEELDQGLAAFERSHRPDSGRMPWCLFVCTTTIVDAFRSRSAGTTTG